MDARSFERSLEEGLLKALGERLALLPVPTDSAAFLAALKRRKSEEGSKALAGSIGLQVPELEAFETVVSGRVRHPEADKEGRIALYRLLSWGETIAERAGLSQPTPAMTGEEGQVLSLKRVRAVELILRSLIAETHQGQDALIAYLGDRVPQETLQKWSKAAEKGNILSGTTFSELASLFIGKEEFPRYAKLFQDDAYLRLLRDKRETIREYLEDIRRVRNVVAHHKQLSDVQTELLDLYYQDLVTPIQHAKDQGRITTDPKKFLDISKEELTAYFNAVREDIQAVRDDLGQLRGEVREGFAELKDSATRSEEKLGDIQQTLRTSWLSRKMVIAYAAVGIVVVVLGFVYQHYTHRPFTVTIHTHGPKGPTDHILSNKGKVLLKATDFQAEAPINERGEAVFTQVPSNLIDLPVQLDVEAMGEAYVPIDPAAKYTLQRDAQVAFPIHLSGSERLRGIVRDLATGAPVPDAQVRIKTVIASTDATGRFDLAIPLELREPFQDVEVTCKGYAYYQDKQVPLQGDGEMEVMLEPTH
ncbi:MAG TPA: carboxypeptidase-like regulatory domain-containing protein [Flavobacteriales bacterium]|nr:carboxypeptidase-like regulatory domain-containing protein [Flavobacteriales bacterium]